MLAPRLCLGSVRVVLQTAAGPRKMARFSDVKLASNSLVGKIRGVEAFFKWEL